MSNANTLDHDFSHLLVSCAQNQQPTINEDGINQLAQWYDTELNIRPELSDQLLATHTEQWAECIAGHRAHLHEWYSFMATDIDIDTMATFLLENVHHPTFIDLLQKILSIQFLPDAVSAVQENIDDEFQPEPHANLMKRMMMAVKERASDSLPLQMYPSLINRTLIFYYGYYLKPWHLVGSLFATEQMGTYRVICMRQALERLKLTQQELAFTVIHSECDEHHADDWLQRVIVPSIEQRPELKPLIAAGIAQCLETSGIYLDFLLARARHNGFVK